MADRGDLRVTGTAKSPRVAWDSKAMRDRLLGRTPRAPLQPLTGLLPPGDSLGAMQRLAGDSARAAEARKARLAFEDSLKKVARGLLRGWFGSTKRDSGR